MVSFDTKGQCPICRRPFQDCRHSVNEAREHLTVKKLAKQLGMLTKGNPPRPAAR